MTQTPNDVEDIIWGGGGAKSAEWPTVGAWVGGPVQSRPRSYHAKEYIKGQPGAGKPKYTQSGEPIMGVKVDVQTSMRDPADASDDGVRRMHLDKWRQLEAVRHALQEAGVRRIEPGGELWVQWTGEEADGVSAQPAKTWAAKYRPPAGSAAGIVDPAHAAAPPVSGSPGMSAASYAPAQAQAPAQQPVSVPQAPQPQPAPAWAQGAPSAAPTGAQGPAWGGQPQAPQAAQAPPAASAPPQNVITAAVEAALKAQGIDTSGFTIVG